jgi:hypothetical protein
MIVKGQSRRHLRQLFRTERLQGTDRIFIVRILSRLPSLTSPSYLHPLYVHGTDLSPLLPAERFTLCLSLRSAVTSAGASMPASRSGYDL